MMGRMLLGSLLLMHALGFENVKRETTVKMESSRLVQLAILEIKSVSIQVRAAALVHLVSSVPPAPQTESQISVAAPIYTVLWEVQCLLKQPQAIIQSIIRVRKT